MFCNLLNSFKISRSAPQTPTTVMLMLNVPTPRARSIAPVTMVTQEMESHVMVPLLTLAITVVARMFVFFFLIMIGCIKIWGQALFVTKFPRTTKSSLL